MTGMKRILIIAAHADDEVLGAGGIIHRWVREGKDVACLFLADGETSRAGGEERIGQRTCGAEAAAAVLGHQILATLNFPDNRLDQVPLLDIVQAIEPHIAAYAPDTVLTHSAADLNADHRRALEATLTACRPLPGHSVRRIASFEVVSATGWNPASAAFNPNCYIALSEQDWNKKQEALQCYDAEMRAYPHYRSYQAIDALAQMRGASVGVERAEALTILRWLEN